MNTMSLRTTVKLATIGVVIGCMTMVAAIGVTYSFLDRAQDRVNFANMLITEAGKLNLLTTELSAHRSDRASQQWDRQFEILSEALIQAPRFDNEADIVKNEIRHRLNSLNRLVARLKNIDSATPSTAIGQAGTEVRGMLLSSILGQSSSIFSRTTEFHGSMTRSAGQTRSYMLLTIAGIFLLMLVGVGSALLLLSTGMLSNILSLRSTIQTISQGDLDEPIPKWASNEIGDVFHELDRMRRNLLESLSDLGRANLELIGIKAKLEDRTTSLEAANRELEAFTSAVSHDLRAPLRTVSGFSEAVLEDYANQIDTDGQAMLARINRASRQMFQLIEDLLRMSRLGRDKLERSSIDLSALAAEIWETIREQNPDNDTTFRVTPGITARGDSQLIRIVLTNLLENAWKFTSNTENGVIEVTRIYEAERPVYVVRDNGVGFDMTYADHLFVPFKRLHAAADYPGTGIGLATVARVISLHGGKIWADGRPNAGASFYFHLGNLDSVAIGGDGTAAPQQPGTKQPLAADDHRSAVPRLARER